MSDSLTSMARKFFWAAWIVTLKHGKPELEWLTPANYRIKLALATSQFYAVKED